jgi:hypothetical protein
MGRLPVHGALGKFTWRMCATVLGAQSLVVFFGALAARGIADASGRSTATAYLLVGSGLAVLAILAAGLMRRPIGVTVGWVVQAATMLAALVVPAMAVIGVIFTTLWVIALVQGERIDAQQSAAGH